MNEELRQTLRAARPSGQDEEDPAVREARIASSADPALVKELEAERRFDLAFAEQLQSMPAPTDLADRLLAAVRAVPVQTPQPPDMEERILSAVRGATPTPHPTRRRWLVAAAAAAAGLAAGGFAWWRRPRPLRLDTLTAELAAISEGGVTLSLMTMDVSAIAAWMAENRAPRADHFPPALDALGRKGCHLYHVAGHPVSLECFMLGSGSVLHLFSAKSRIILDPPPPGDPVRVTASHDHTVAVWSSGRLTLMLLSREPAEIIQSLLA